jgi:hypothetical protein
MWMIHCFKGNNMNKFIQYIPTFVDADAPEWHEFETTAELLSLEIVKRYGQDNDFSHFVLSENRLMEISDNGFHWWVVGYIEDPTTVNLPQWEGWKFRAEMPDGRKVILSDEVVSSCGDRLTLKDGTVARNLRG